MKKLTCNNCGNNEFNVVMSKYTVPDGQVLFFECTTEGCVNMTTVALAPREMDNVMGMNWSEE